LQHDEVLSFQPRLLECLRDYSRARFGADVLAGLTVGVVALPLAIGLGVASGVLVGGARTTWFGSLIEEIAACTRVLTLARE
jgi:hypothetical protein